MRMVELRNQAYHLTHNRGHAHFWLRAALLSRQNLLWTTAGAAGAILLLAQSDGAQPSPFPGGFEISPGGPFFHVSGGPGAARRTGALVLCLALCLLGPGLFASAQTFTTIDPRGAIQTDADGINPAGTIAGWYLDASNVYHGFLRAADGTFTTFDAPGAGTGAGQGTRKFDLGGINPAGAIAGLYIDVSNVSHGYLRAPNGTFTTFDAPGAGTGLGQGTFSQGINPEGAISGTSLDVNSVYHGFLRAPDGTITTIDAPGAGTGFKQGTRFPTSINPAGAIVGDYIDASNVFHGYLRAPNGTFTTITPPGATGSTAESINPAGAITGNFRDAIGGHGYLRAPDGTFTTFDAPGAVHGTVPLDINPAGAITGVFIDANGVQHGFLRSP